MVVNVINYIYNCEIDYNFLLNNLKNEEISNFNVIMVVIICVYTR